MGGKPKPKKNKVRPPRDMHNYASKAEALALIDEIRETIVEEDDVVRLKINVEKWRWDPRWND